MKTFAALAVMLVITIATASLARGEQVVVPTADGTKVVHNRVAPVVMHRVLPPYAGHHVYRGRR